MSHRLHTNRFLLNASWLIKLRWVAVVGQLITVFGARFMFEIELPVLATILVMIGLTAGSNLFLIYWFARWQKLTPQERLPWDLVLGLVLIMDLLSLTTLLFVTGGPNNPFSLFYFVNVSLSALVLNRKWAWAINGLTIICFAGLMHNHLELHPLEFGLNTLMGGGPVTLQHIGFLVAFGTCSSVITYFMTRLTDELREQQIRVRRAEALQARADKIEALGTLAAGAAHELATPLSTIAVVAKDVEGAFEIQLSQFPGAIEVLEDVRLIRSQLERCRKIIDRMGSHAGEAVGEKLQALSIEKVALVSLEGLLERNRVQLSFAPDAREHKVKVPLDGLTQALRGLIQNALDADPTDQLVKVSLDLQGDRWRMQIRDRGPGMTDEHLRRVSEPFFTTKPPGKGMGLGVFLAQNVVNRLGGSIQFQSRPGEGTCVTVELPV
jgi:two-component system, sensor histidine kinase RegB